MKHSKITAGVIIIALLFSFLPVRASKDSIPLQIRTAPFVDAGEVENVLKNSEISIEEYNSQIETVLTETKGNYHIKASLHQAAYDPRKTGEVTAIKNQLPFGTCWSYGAAATAESALIKQGYEDNTVDLSELQYIYKQWKDMYAYESYDYAFNQGAPVISAWNYMRKGIGPEYEDVFGSVQDYYGADIAEEILSSHEYDLASIQYAKADDIYAVKDLITEFGGVAAVYYSGPTRYYLSNPVNACDKTYNNTGDSTYYLPANVTSVNHLIEIVGWDDNYPKENFKMQPKGDGAWLVKNSWGENYLGDFSDNLETYLEENEEALASPTGYYWISYEEYSIRQTAAIAVSFKEKDTVIRDIEIEDLSLKTGETYQLNPKVLPETATNKNLIYCLSQGEDIITVSDAGLITAKSTGVATVTISSEQVFDYNAMEPCVFYEIVITVQDEEPVTTEEVTEEAITTETVTTQETTTETEATTEVPAPKTEEVTEATTTTEVMPQVKNMKLSKTKYVYTGKKISPKVTVWLTDGTKLSKKYYHVTYQRNKNIGTAKAVITFSDIYQNTSKQTLTFQIIPKTPSIKIKKAGNKRIITIKPVKGATGYEVQYANNKAMKNAVKKRTGTSIVIDKRFKYVRVRAYKKIKGKTYYSTWSKAKKAG